MEFYKEQDLEMKGRKKTVILKMILACHPGGRSLEVSPKVVAAPCWQDHKV